MANHIGSKPSEMAMGMNIGAKRMMMAKSSMNIPKMSRRTCIPMRMTQRLTSIPIIRPSTIPWAPAVAYTFPKRVAVIRIHRTIPVTLRVSMHDDEITFQLNLR